MLFVYTVSVASQVTEHWVSCKLNEEVGATFEVPFRLRGQPDSEDIFVVRRLPSTYKTSSEPALTP